MADKPSRGLVVYGDGHATILPSGVAANSSAHHHLDSFASHASCGFLSLRSTTLSPNDIEDDNTIRELAQLLDVYDFYTAKNEENRQGTAIMDQHQPAVSKISDRFMGLRAAMFTICPRVSYFASKLGFRVFQTEDLSAEFDSTDGVLQKDDNDPKIVTRFLGLLGFSGGHAHEISEVDLVFVHVSMEKTENKATKLGSEANLDWLDKLVGGIMKAVPPGSAIATRLHLSVILSYGSIYDWEERFSLISNSSTETNSDLVLLRPRQSYSLKAGNTLDDIRHHHPMLLAQWQEGVTRKDLTKMFSFEEFIKVMDRIIYTYSGGTVTLGIGGVKLHDMSMQVTTFATAPTFVQLEDEIHMRLSTSRGTHELIVQGKYEAGTGAVGQNQFQALLPLSSESTWELYNEVVRNSPIRMLEVVVEVRSIQQSEYATEEAGIAANMSVQEINNYTLPIATNSVDVHEDSFWRAEPGQNIPSPNIPALSPYVEHAIYYDQVHVGTSSMADISNPFDAAYANNEYDARAYGEVEADDEDIGIEYSDRSEDEEDRTEDTPATDFILCRRGETTITLQDVAMLLGLPIRGRAVTGGRPHANWRQLLIEEIGQAPDAVPAGAKDRRTAGVSRAWLRTHFDGIIFDGLQNPDDATIARFARAYMLSLLGNVMFADSAGDTISIALIPFIHNFQSAGEYSWGSGVLAYLYRQLCDACRRASSSPSIGGCALLLQLWAWEHFPIGRPNREEWAPPPVREHPSEYPTIAMMWRGCRQDHQAPVNCYIHYTNEFDMLMANQVRWEPYERDEIRNLGYLNPVCRQDAHLWRTHDPLIYSYAVEMHVPNRVRRQFGKCQEYPPSDVRTGKDLHKLSRQRTKVKDWQDHLSAYIELWERG